ncbi:uncharacterized protein V1513DRAFT_445489 [Lipomyces chichibuensis]|uniref:uncharacterized protein n=1 Tax=Lipomyces chichibuensis TaxID=1546026 RepID=UPI00334406F2
MFETVLGFCANVWISGAYILEIIAPYILYQHIRQAQRRWHSAVDLRGISVDYIILSLQSCLYRIIYIFAYIFPTTSLDRQYAARHYRAPDINKVGILSGLPHALSTLLTLILILLPEFTRAISQLRLRFSTIAKIVSATTFTAATTAFVLATSFKFDPATGMGFWGLFYIDAVDLLKGIADWLDCVRFWPQVVINWEEGNTVAFDTTYPLLLLTSAACHGMGMLFTALAKNDIRLAVRPPGTVLYIIYTMVVCGVFYFQSCWVYSRDNARILRGFTKRSDEDGNDEVQGRVREEELIGLTPLAQHME